MERSWHSSSTSGASSPEPDFRALFDALPGLYLVLQPNDPTYTIVAANHAYLEATMTTSAAIVGRGVFEAFPDNPDDPHAAGVRNLLASLREVLARKSRHAMAALKYDIRRPDDQGGGFEERYWSPMNTPLLGDGGEVRFIIHRVEDVTELLSLKRMEAEQGRLTEDLRIRADHMEAELFLRGRQLAESQRLARERQEMEQKLWASEARFSLAFAQAPIGMVLLTPEGKIVEINQAYVEMLGYTREELTSRDSSFYTHPDDTALTKDFFASLRKGPHATGSIEKRYFRKNGETLWARASATMRRDDRGIPTLVIAIVEDITARKRAEERYRFLAESIPQMVWTATPDGMLDYVNRQGEAYFRIPQASLLGAGWLDRVHAEDRERTVERWKNSLATATPYEVEFRLKRGSDESWRWHLVRALPLAGENGNVVQWFGTCTDIEDQKQADANLKQQWHTFDTALSHSPDLTYTFDLAGRFTYANRALLAIWQKSLDEVYGKNFFELEYPPDLARRLHGQIERLIATGQPIRDQVPFTGANGETRDYEHIFVPVVDAEGRVQAVAGSTRDITEQNKAARRIEDDRRRWRDLLLQVPAAVAVLRGPAHRFEWVNPDYARLIGRPADSIAGKTVLETLPELESQIYMDLLNRVYRTGEPFVGHESLFRIDRGDGALEEVFVNFVYTPTRDANGEIDGIFAHIIDVTALVAARLRVEASEKRFRAAAQANSSILWTNNASGEMVGDQPGWSGFTGQTYGQYQGFGWSKAVHPEDAQPTVDAWNQAVAEQRMFVFEHRVRRYDGEWRLFSIRAVPVFDEEGGIAEWVGVHNDITDERTLLTALRQSEARFRQVIDSMPQQVWSTLPDGEPDLYNKQWFEYTGLPSERRGIGLGESIHPDDQTLARERWSRSLLTGEPYEIEFRCRRFDGQYRWFLARAQPIRDEKGVIVRWFGTNTDIEDRKKAELAILTKQKLESLGLLAGGIAHDFNNLLVGVLGGASYAAEALPKADPLQPVLGGIVEAAERAAHLTRQMLAYAGKGRFLIEPVDLSELVRSTCNLIKGTVPKHVQLTLDTPGRLPAIEADLGQMQQIVMNLILNAAESVDPKRAGSVTARTSMARLDSAAISRIELVAGSLAPGAYIVLQVQDNGSGMDHETQVKIFDPFFTTKFTGRGLGLSAVQGILRTHNGALELSTQVGEGSTFRVFFPASGKTAPGKPPAGDDVRDGVGTVLIVDDEEIVRRTGKLSLERAGFGTVLAESGERALDILADKKTALNLILLDMTMPGMNGKDVLGKIRGLGIGLPVLICSGHSETEVYREFSGFDIAGIVQKPFTSDQLKLKVRAALQETP